MYRIKVKFLRGSILLFLVIGDVIHTALCGRYGRLQWIIISSFKHISLISRRVLDLSQMVLEFERKAIRIESRK